MCTGCKKVKDVECFDKHPLGKGGRHPKCKTCRSEYESQRHANLTEEQRQAIRDSRKSDLSKFNNRFGRHKITRDDYLKMVEEQDGKCAICGDYQGVALVIDHCHTENKVRQLLCRNCNCGLGMFREKIETLETAIRYLRKHGALAEAGIAPDC